MLQLPTSHQITVLDLSASPEPPSSPVEARIQRHAKPYTRALWVRDPLAPRMLLLCAGCPKLSTAHCPSIEATKRFSHIPPWRFIACTQHPKVRQLYPWLDGDVEE